MTLRVDDVTSDRLKAYVDAHAERYGIKRVLMYDEVSDVVQKQHLQGIIGLVPLPDAQTQNKHIATMRKSLQSFFDRRGTQLSFKQVKDYTGYTAYIVKQGNQVLNVGYTPDEVRAFEAKAQEVQMGMARNQKGTAKGTPMERMFDAFETWYLAKYEERRKVRLGVTHGSFMTDNLLARFVIMYYGEIAHKSFMKKKMAECANYLKYRALQKYDGYKHEEFLETTSSHIVDYMNL